MTYKCIVRVQMETLDFVFWFRQAIGLSIGLGAGMLHLTGMYVIIGFVVVMLALSNIYVYKVLNVSDDDFQNSELTMEGLPNSLGIFLVSIGAPDGAPINSCFLIKTIFGEFY